MFSAVGRWKAEIRELLFERGNAETGIMEGLTAQMFADTITTILLGRGHSPDEMNRALIDIDSLMLGLKMAISGATSDFESHVERINEELVEEGYACRHCKAKVLDDADFVMSVCPGCGKVVD